MRLKIKVSSLKTTTAGPRIDPTKKVSGITVQRKHEGRVVVVSGRGKGLVVRADPKEFGYDIWFPKKGIVYIDADDVESIGEQLSL